MLPATALRRVSTSDLDVLQRSICTQHRAISTITLLIVSFAATQKAHNRSAALTGMALAGTTMNSRAGRAILCSSWGRHREALPGLNIASSVTVEPIRLTVASWQAAAKERRPLPQAMQVAVQQTE